ncbi:glycosyltransferase family 4 protein [Georgenia ruanii]|nr:glycosyltransferase family 4 protein [Georgenia ruanii]MPV87617.1 glycosyltransferase [Georgenia ruanii]
MRIVLTTRIFTPEPAAASFRLHALVTALGQVGHRVTVLTTRYPEAEAVDPAGAVVKRWPVLRDAQGYVRGYLQYVSFDAPLALRLLREPADVVVTEPPPTTGAVVRVIAAIRRVPYVYYAADVWSDAAAQTAPAALVALLRRLEGWAMRGARRVIAVSDEVAARVRELGVREVDVVPNGIDTRTFTPDGAAASPGAYLLYAGTASEWQGADIFVRAMPQVLAQVPEARLVFVGQGSAWEQIRELSTELAPDAVELLSTMPPEEVARWQRGAAAALVSIVPGQGYDFAYPTKVLAALASGTPALFAGVGPAAEDIAAHDLGEVVAYDVDAVAAAMIRALQRGRNEAVRLRLVEWVEQHRSLRTTGRRAAGVVAGAGTAAVPGRRKSPDGDVAAVAGLRRPRLRPRR